MNSIHQLRHRLHSMPELMFEEYNTTETILAYLQQFTGLQIHRPLPTGLVVEYTVNNGPYMLFRADIDALPVQEETGCQFSSCNSNMHACGHDVHASILAGFIEYVCTNNIQQNLLFVFQPGEEGGGGAERIINSGILDTYNIIYAFAQHVTDEYDFGTIATTPGTLFAAAVEIDVDIYGKSAHIAFPERGIHALQAMMQFLQRADEIISKAPKPVLFGYGKVYSGTARNIIPGHARAEGTLRTVRVALQEDIVAQFTKELESLANKLGITYKLNLSSPYTEVVVDHKLHSKIIPILAEHFSVIDCGLKMTAEDFGLFTAKYPSYMHWLGTGKGERHGLHTPKFLPPDEIIEQGIEVNKLILHNVCINL
ncbi:MAG: amidohydrolase [Ignavibacteria bacterium]|nr:amidohydrolase [Ignavibacteria bacterium]